MSVLKYSLESLFMLAIIVVVCKKNCPKAKFNSKGNKILHLALLLN
jgi:hypothetical protein